ncbi:T9SS type A sorting domain-containing protein [Psychroserpens sp. Hel_I_66]|uniref:T9SS type A sorting domain-containing protein n=1 Tax=Psychroserpens sp. Hel_I_66 TaxID=1250004 RepID=UPI000645943C|nr:T9SS type A sorting domain-containing protein [Psychroserpens sp. Hel_I_66]
MKKITFILFALICSLGFSQTFTANGPYDIQNGQTGTLSTCGTFDLSIPLNVSGIGTLGTTNVLQSVTLNITHTYNADIEISLQDPSGTVTVLLTDSNGGNGDGFVNVVLEDGSPELPSGNASPITGTFSPDEPLAGFNIGGVSADGDWILLVCDNANGDVGQIDNWSLTFEPAPTCADPTDLMATPTNATTALLEWNQVGPISSWDIELVDITASETATGTATSTGVSNPTTLNALTPSNDYEVYVRANCSGSEVSNWVGPIPFTTPAACEAVATVAIDNVTDVSVDFSWDAPELGTPVGYNWEIVEDGSGQGGTVIANGSTPTTNVSSGDVLTLDTDYDIYVQTDCDTDGTSVWAGPFGFTTQPGPIPANNDCLGSETITQETDIADASSATSNAGAIVGATPSGLAAETCNDFTGSANDDVWYVFEALTTNVNITYEANFDAVAILYSGTCGVLTVVDCADGTGLNTPGGTVVEEINATGLTVGEIYYTRIYQFNTSNTAGKTFDLKIWSPDTLSTEEFENENAFSYFPNPVKNELTLNAQKNIQNVSVYNMLGQEVLRIEPNTVDTNINMNGLRQGAYIVKVTIDNVTETVRIIKQ